MDLSVAQASSRAGILPRVAVGASAVLLVLLYAWAGPSGPFALAALAVTALLGLALLPRLPLIALLPGLGLILLAGQIAPGVHAFDGIAVALAALAALMTIQSEDRRVWELHGPGHLALAAVTIPLIALPFTVVSVSSYLGGYKELVLPVLLFLSLRRLVPRDRSHLLLWVFPLAGTVGALQLLMRTRGLDARLYERMELRNFYANVGWGWSNYIAAVIELCLLLSLLLAVLDRRWQVRVVLLAAALLMAQALLVLFSRAGTLALGLAGLIIAIGWGGRRGLAAFGTLIALALAGLATPGGQAIAKRFVNPTQFASYYDRFVIYSQAWERFLAHPLTGIGLNQGRYQGDMMGEGRGHNPLLDALMTQGISGGILVVVLTVAIYRLCARATPAGTAATSRTVRTVLVATVTAVLAHASVESILNGHTMAFLFAWFLAWLTLQDPRGRAAEGIGATAAPGPAAGPPPAAATP